MIEIADVFRRFAADYVSAHSASMLPSHRRAIEDILDCRTAALGGQVWRCAACKTEMFSYHSCGNRSCPKCHTAQTQEWLEHRQAELLPVPYFHITITVPEELREVLRANQRDGYGVLMRASAAAIIELARDPRYVGGTVGVLAVLHTWTQQLNLHPHVQCLVSGGGISEDASTWHPARRKFLLPIKALAKLVRGKFRALLRQKCPDLVIPEAVWRRPWILHVTAWGDGEQAVLDYLARYVFRIALTNARIVGLDDETVTIQYEERKTGGTRTCRLSGGICSTLLDDRFPVEDCENRLIRILSPSGCGSDDGSNAGEQIGTPGRTEATCDFAVGGGGPQFPLAAIVVRWNLRMLQEGEQVAAHLPVTLSQPPAMVVGRRQHHDGVQLAIQPGLIGAPRARGQLLAPPRQHDGPQQQRLHAWGE